MNEETDKESQGATLRTGTGTAASEAARVLGSAKTEQKAAAGRANLEKARAAMEANGVKRGRHLAPLSDIPCTCEAGDALEGHKWNCPRGAAIIRRRKAGKL